MDSYIAEKIEVSQTLLIRKVYVWMCAALLITAVTAYRVSNSEELLRLIFSSKMSFFGIIIAQFAIVWFLSARIKTLTFSTATILFALYSVLMGVTMSCIFLAYTQSSIASTFFITAGTFAVMSIYGFTTKKDLTSIGGLLIMALVGLIIASVVNYFLKSSMFDLIISCIGVLIFVGLTAYDTQKIKALMNQENTEENQKMAIIGSLMLYLDFINLFLFLLRIFGRRR
ncbi:MAG: Bax inhibitor-1/YccA family protein [Paludibacter sp.]|nr:Bax inhibitor-1/YccA family protein [Paludibacter sp.]